MEEENKPKGRIIDVICPHCQKTHLQLKKRHFREEGRWECVSCVYTFPEGWFDQLFQYEKFVTRGGD